MVDIIGSGNTQDIFSGYVNQIGNHIVHMFYFATSFIDKENPLSIKHTYCTEPKPHYHYIELLMRSKEGQTLRYKDKGKILPVTEEGMSDALNTWGIEEYLKGIVDFSERMVKLNIYYNEVDFCYIYHDYTTIKCLKSIANIIGEIPFAVSGLERNVYCVAPKIPTIKLMIMKLFKLKLSNKSEFPHLTYARANSALSLFIKFLRIFSFCSNIYIELKLLNLLKNNKDKKIMLWGASLFLQDFLKKEQYRLKENALRNQCALDDETLHRCYTVCILQKRAGV